MHIQISWRNLIETDHLKDLTLFWKKATPDFLAGSRAAHRKIAMSDIPNRVSYCKFCIVNT